MIHFDDPLAAFQGLRDRDYAREGLFVCEGRIVVDKALSCGAAIRALVCVPADEESWLAVSGGRFPVTALGRSEMADLVGFEFHRGSLALAERPAPRDPSSVPAGHALVLWNVTDPDNLGALIRSASALGAVRVYLGPGCADPLGRKALRTSMACSLGLPIVRLSGIEELSLARGPAGGPGADGARAEGGDGPAGNALVAAALVPGALEPRLVASEAVAAGTCLTLVLGNEGWGLPAGLVAACDRSVIVPMAAGVDSLNVGAAGAILMWELFRSRADEFD